MASIACYRWFIVEFDFIFIFINDDCDWTQRNDKYVHCMWAHFQHQRVEFVVWRSCCILSILFFFIFVNYIISSYQWWYISLFWSSLSLAHPTIYFDTARMHAYADFHLFKLQIFPSILHFSFYLLSKWRSCKFLVGKFMCNSSLFHYKTLLLWCCYFCCYFIEWTINWN